MLSQELKKMSHRIASEAENFEGALKNVNVKGGHMGTVDEDAETISVGLIFEEGFGGDAFIYYAVGESEDHIIEELYRGRDDELYNQGEHPQIFKELMDEAKGEGKSENDAWLEAYDNMSEGWDFGVWTMPQEDFWGVIDDNPEAAKYV